jgi:hypothetical protein
MVDMKNAPKTTNPVVKSTPLDRYPGWTVRQYADGMYDATHTGPGLSPGFDTFGECVAHVREQEAR